jgi:hypothetical protein
MLPFILLFAAAAGLYWYETIYKPSQEVTPPPSTPPSPTSPTYTAGGITFLNPNLATLVLTAMNVTPGTATARTDDAGRTYYSVEPSTDLTKKAMGDQLTEAVSAGAIVIIVGTWASWAASGASGMPPTTPQVLVTDLPGAVDVHAQALSLLNLTGGGVAIGPPPSGQS